MRRRSLIARVLATWALAAGLVGILEVGQSAVATELPMSGNVNLVACAMNNPYGLVPGPYQSMWFINRGNGTIGRIASGGIVSCFNDPSINIPTKIVAGPDGNMWFANSGNSSIGRITPAGSITNYANATISSPQDIRLGPDNNLWFTNPGNNSIGRITPTGVVSNFADPTISSPQELIVGPDKNVWFTNHGNNSIGRITQSGVIAGFPSGVAPENIVAGPDGNVWFTGCGYCTHNGSIGRITPAGSVSVFATDGAPTGLTAGSDGNFWFSAAKTIQCGSNCTAPVGSMNKITPAGAISVVAGWSVPGFGPPARGPAGSMWFVHYSVVASNVIERINPDGTGSSFSDAAILWPTNFLADSVGNMWFANLSSPNDPPADSIGRISVVGAVSIFTDSGLRGDDLASGPDGNLWLANAQGNTVARITPNGVQSIFSDPTISSPQHIITGSDQNMWFTNAGNNSIGRITPAGVVSNFTGPSISQPRAIARGPDGNVWFANDGNGSIGRITPSGLVSSFADPLPYTVHRGITAGPDGNVWFTAVSSTSPSTSRIGRVDPQGVISLFADASIDQPWGISAGSDGNLWFINAGNSSIGRISPAGVVSNFANPALKMFWLGSISRGPDGNMWFVNGTGGSIWRITAAGELSTVGVVNPRGGGLALTPGPGGNMWFAGVGLMGFLGPDRSGAPSPPVGVTASAGPSQARVSWSPPPGGGAPVTGYRVIAWPGAQPCVWSGGPLSCVVTGLTPGTPYVFAVIATSASGIGLPSVLSSPVIPWGGSAFYSLTPTRVLDSRSGPGAWPGALPGGTTRDLDMASVSGVPATATAIVANVTATGGSADSFVTVWPSEQSQPNTSNLNFAAGQTVANQMTVGLGPRRMLSFANAVGSVDLVVDVVGYFDDVTAIGGLFNPVGPARILDSRDGTGGWSGSLPANTTRDLRVRGVAGIPAAATAVVANVTATGGSAGSFVTVWPSGQSQPNTSNLNFAAGQTIANLVTVGIGPNGDASFANAVGSVDLVVDVVGYYESGTGSRFHPMRPTRVLDNRVGIGLSGTWGPDQTRTLPIAAQSGTGIPYGATALVANITATNATSGSFVAAFSGDAVRPTSSTLNFGPGQTIANSATVSLSLSWSSSIALYNQQGTVDLIADVVGYYKSP